jgi:hypothetical protein
MAGHHRRGENLAGGVGVPQGHPAARRACLSSRTARRASQPGEAGPGRVCKILAEHAVKPHKVRYYLEQRNPEFEPKVAEILCVYRQGVFLVVRDDR